MNLVMKSDLAERLDQAETDVLHSRLTAIKNRDENPMGVEIKRIGQTTAFLPGIFRVHHSISLKDLRKPIQKFWIK